MELIVVTGVSGAGKSRTVAALEDIGFFCVDNIPPRLIENFAEIAMANEKSLSKVAVVVDVRSKDMFLSLNDSLKQLKAKNINVKVLFLTADDKVLQNRFKETRRSHPLMGDDVDTLELALSEENRMLENIKQNSDYIIDTSFLSNSQLRETVTNMFKHKFSEGMLVNCMSFGFKYGPLGEADFLLDVRCLPNPYYIDELKEKNGLSEEVREYVLSFGETQGLISKFLDLIDYLLPLYLKEGKSQLVLAVGCTGGMHRSVVLAELLHNHITRLGYESILTHRDIEKKHN